ncbi:MAG TPA: S49 family peptidase [Paludibacter sp.]|nr:S49 family peptidase [Paludibacter sp.]
MDRLLLRPGEPQFGHLPLQPRAGPELPDHRRFLRQSLSDLRRQRRLSLLSLLSQFQRCADGRHKTPDQIKAIAEGRVWTGEDALKIGLIDKLGGLNDAIKIAAEKAKVSNYRIKEYPEKEDFSTKLMKSFGEEAEARYAKAFLGENYKLFKHIKDIEKINGIQARMPFDMIIR